MGKEIRGKERGRERRREGEKKMYLRDKMYLKTQVLNVNSGPGHDKLFCGFSLRCTVGRKNACTLLNESFLNMLCRPWCHFPCNKDLLVNSLKYSIYLSVVVGNEQGGRVQTPKLTHRRFSPTPTRFQTSFPTFLGCFWGR